MQGPLHMAGRQPQPLLLLFMINAPEAVKACRTGICIFQDVNRGMACRSESHHSVSLPVHCLPDAAICAISQLPYHLVPGFQISLLRCKLCTVHSNG